MGKFFNDNVKTNKSTIVKLAIIAVFVVLIIIILIVINNKQSQKNPNLKLKNELNIPVNSPKPDPLDYFTDFNDYDINEVVITYPDNFDTAKVGNYEVKLKILGDTYTTTVNVYDNENPVIELHDLEINQGERYYPEDFVTSCTDNSNNPCVIDYYDAAKDQDGNIIDYTSYTEPGTYTVQITASDDNGNRTEPLFAKLIIKDANGNATGNPISNADCKYGTLAYDDTIYNFPIAVIVGDEVNNCALNRDLWDDEEVQKPVVRLFEQDKAKLKIDFNKIYEEKYPDGARTYVYQNFKTILNNGNKGLVGYGIHVKLYAAPANVSSSISVEENLIAEYYLLADGSRQYIANPYNIK